MLASTPVPSLKATGGFKGSGGSLSGFSPIKKPGAEIPAAGPWRLLQTSAGKRLLIPFRFLVFASPD
jgi:hypothetical protein